MFLSLERSDINLPPPDSDMARGTAAPFKVLEWSMQTHKLRGSAGYMEETFGQLRALLRPSLPWEEEFGGLSSLAHYLITRITLM